MTPQSLHGWDLDQLARDLQAEGLLGLDMYSGVDYISRTWARVLLVRGGAVAGTKLEEDTVVPTPLAFYVRFVEELNDWRVHLLGPPNLDLEQLP